MSFKSAATTTAETATTSRNNSIELDLPENKKDIITMLEVEYIL
jgi:hypothetical protein